MIDRKKCLGVIVARGGSKGLPGKNLANLGGRSLLSWTIDAAKVSKYLDRTILSSNDEAIMAEARRLDCEVPFRRPDALATDESPVADTLIHALDQVDGGYDFIVLLQVSSPLRTAQDIDACIEVCHRNVAPSALSVTEAPKPSQWVVHVDERTGRMASLVSQEQKPMRRQDLPREYVMNGAVYVAETQWYRAHRVFLSADTQAYIMPKERSVDIDDWIDLCTAQAVVAHAAKQ